jgi:hypothetical protein
LALYGAIVVVHAVLLKSQPLSHRLAAVPLIVLAHLMYGIGFWRGLFTKVKSFAQDAATRVTLETVKPMSGQ